MLRTVTIVLELGADVGPTAAKTIHECRRRIAQPRQYVRHPLGHAAALESLPYWWSRCYPLAPMVPTWIVTCACGWVSAGKGYEGAAPLTRIQLSLFTRQYLAETYPALVREDWTKRAIHASRPPLALPRRASDSA